MYICTHLEVCSVKFTNAYSYVFDIISNGGVCRVPESDLKNKALK